jgi:hypothetical protein
MMSTTRQARVAITPEVLDEILRRIADGEPLLRICGPSRGPGMPDRVSVHRRLREDREFRRAYLLAREAQAAHLAEEILAIADGEGRDGAGGDGRLVGRDWLRVSARKWLAGVMAPRTYSGRGAIADELAQMDAEDAREPMSDIHLAAQIAGILESARLEVAELEEQGLEIGEDGETVKRITGGGG